MSPTRPNAAKRADGRRRCSGNRPGDTLRRDNFYGGKDNIIITTRTKSFYYNYKRMVKSHHARAAAAAAIVYYSSPLPTNRFVRADAPCRVRLHCTVPRNVKRIKYLTNFSLSGPIVVIYYYNTRASDPSDPRVRNTFAASSRRDCRSRVQVIPPTLLYKCVHIPYYYK